MTLRAVCTRPALESRCSGLFQGPFCLPAISLPWGDSIPASPCPLTLFLPSQNSSQFMKHTKRRKLTVEDFNRALRWSSVEVSRAQAAEASADTTHLRALLGAGTTERHDDPVCAQGKLMAATVPGAQRFGEPSWKSWDSMQALKGGLH